MRESDGEREGEEEAVARVVTILLIVRAFYSCTVFYYVLYIYKATGQRTLSADHRSIDRLTWGGSSI